MTSTTPPASSRNAFLRELDTAHGASMGLILLRTKEPLRAEELLLEWAHARNVTSAVYRASRGWCGLTQDGKLAPLHTTLATATAPAPGASPSGHKPLPRDPTDAIMATGGTDTKGQDYPSAALVNLWVAHSFHKLLRDWVLLQEIVLDLAADFPNAGRQLYFVVPDSFVVPDLLQHAIAIVDLPLPASDELLEVYDDCLESACEEYGGTPEEAGYDEDELRVISNTLAGMTLQEAETAISKAIVLNEKSFPRVPLESFLSVLRTQKSEAVKRSDVLEILPRVAIEDVGGLDNLKDFMQDAALAFAPGAAEFGVEHCRGIALTGAPGTGKSWAAKAIASVLGQEGLRLDVSRLFRGIVGESEGSVRSAMNFIRAAAPCVVMVDELDKAGMDQNSHKSSDVSDRILSVILTEMQEGTAPILWVFTINRIGKVPPEMLRPGRIDAIFHLPAFLSVEERAQVIRIHLRKRGFDLDAGGLEYAAQHCRGYVASEIECAVKRAILTAFRTGDEMTAEFIAESVSQARPMSETRREEFEEMDEWARVNARPASSMTELVHAVPSSGPRSTPAPAKRRRSRREP